MVNIVTLNDREATSIVLLLRKVNFLNNTFDTYDYKQAAIYCDLLAKRIEESKMRETQLNINE